MRRVIATVLLTIIAGVVLALAQQPDQAAMKQQLQQRLGELKQTMAKDKASLATYAWVETTEISMKGEVKSRKLSHPVRERSLTGLLPKAGLRDVGADLVSARQYKRRADTRSAPTVCRSGLRPPGLLPKMGSRTNRTEVRP